MANRSRHVYKKRAFSVAKIRRFLEPGPVVLVSSADKDETDIMTLGWQTVMEFTPSLVGCMISSGNYTFDLIRRSKECVINIPEAHLARTVVKIGNSTGAEIDKFHEFGLTAEKALKVKAPIIRECYAHIECRLVNDKLVDKYNFFIFEAVKAYAATSPRYPRTLHYRGDGVFMVSGRHINLRPLFTKVL